MVEVLEFVFATPARFAGSFLMLLVVCLSISEMRLFTIKIERKDNNQDVKP